MKVLALLPSQPFPPVNGQTQRLAHVVQALAARHDVWLGCFTTALQGPMAPAARAPFRAVCEVPEGAVDGALIARLHRRVLAREPYDVARFRSPAMAAFVAAVLRDVRPDIILIGDPALTQYVPPGGPPAVLDYVCEVLLQIERMRDRAGLPDRWLWEGRRRVNLRHLQSIAGAYGAVFLNSREDVASIARYWPAERLDFVPNGLDMDGYPLGLAAPVPGRMIYAGSVLYPPNRDAVAWFAADILPRIRAAVPGAELVVTGGHDDTAPQAEGLRYTGRVPDVRVEIAAAAVSVVPLRLGAGGARFKVIESMALGTPVVGTAVAVEGLDLVDGADFLAAEGEAAIADACVALLTDPGRRAAISAGGRARIAADYDWQALFARIEARMLALAQARRAA
ncbi:MAG: glycosyltransferase family 4 protein [Gemmobacter sp.]